MTKNSYHPRAVWYIYSQLTLGEQVFHNHQIVQCTKQAQAVRRVADFCPYIATCDHIQTQEDLPPSQAAFDVLRHSPDLVEVVGSELCNSTGSVERAGLGYTAPWNANILVRVFLTASSVRSPGSTLRKRLSGGVGFAVNV